MLFRRCSIQELRQEIKWWPTQSQNPAHTDLFLFKGLYILLRASLVVQTVEGIQYKRPGLDL